MYLFSRLSKCRDKGSNLDLTHARQIFFKAVCYRFLFSLLFKWQKCRVTQFTNETSNLRSTFREPNSGHFTEHTIMAIAQKRNDTPSTIIIEFKQYHDLVYMLRKRVGNESITVFLKIVHCQHVLDRFLPHQVLAG